jgi:hypothetical protein
MWGSSISHNPMDLQDLLRGQLYFSICRWCSCLIGNISMALHGHLMGIALQPLTKIWYVLLQMRRPRMKLCIYNSACAVWARSSWPYEIASTWASQQPQFLHPHTQPPITTATITTVAITITTTFTVHLPVLWQPISSPWYLLVIAISPLYLNISIQSVSATLWPTHDIQMSLWTEASKFNALQHTIMHRYAIKTKGGDSLVGLGDNFYVTGWKVSRRIVVVVVTFDLLWTAAIDVASGHLDAQRIIVMVWVIQKTRWPPSLRDVIDRH